MNVLTQGVAELFLISAVASPMVLVILLLKPVNARFQTLKWQNFLLKTTLLLFFLPVYSLLGEVTFPEAEEENRVRVEIESFLPTSLDTPEIAFESTTKDEITDKLAEYFPFLSIVWIFGVILSIFFHRYCYKKFKSSIQSASLCKDETVLELFRVEKEKLGISKTIPLYSSKLLVSPLVSGIFSPKIYVPEGNSIEKHVLTHELLHYKTKDLWWKALLLLGKVIHWYNPFIYLLGRELEENLEFCCDFQVVQSLNGEEKKEYALTILSTYEKGTLYGLGLNHRPKQLERRVKSMFEKKKKSVLVASFTGFTLLFVLGMASTMAKQSSFKEDMVENVQDGTIHMGASSSGATEDLAVIFDLQNRISEEIWEEFSVEAAVIITDYDTNPLVSVVIDHSNTENQRNDAEMEELVREMMPQGEMARIDIIYPIIGENLWDETQKNPFSDVDVGISAEESGLELSIRDPNMTEEEKIKMYELERNVVELMFSEFSVESVATLLTSVTYSGEMKLSITIDNRNLTNLLDNEKIREVITPLLTEWNTDRIEITYTVPMEEMPIIGENLWDETQKNPFSEVDVEMGGTSVSNTGE